MSELNFLEELDSTVKDNVGYGGGLVSSHFISAGNPAIAAPATDGPKTESREEYNPRLRFDY